MKNLLSSTVLAGTLLLGPHAFAQNNQGSSARPAQSNQGQSNQGQSAQQTQARQGGGSVTRPGDTQSMEELRQAAQQLRESIQAMAQQPAGERRNQAMDAARDALLTTQSAMAQLPAEMRKTEEWREAQQRAGETQAALNAREPNQQQAQQSSDRLSQAIQGFNVPAVSNPRYATALIDKNLVGSNGQDVGHVDDLVFDSNWRVRGAVVEWGGFLGIGERRAIVPANRISLPANRDDRARLNMTREELERLPSYERPSRAG